MKLANRRGRSSIFTGASFAPAVLNGASCPAGLAAAAVQRRKVTKLESLALPDDTDGRRYL